MLIGLTGFIGSGKNTVADYFVEAGYRQDSFAATLKDACSLIFDWDRELLEGTTQESRAWRETPDEWWSQKLSIPDFSPRLALQLVGTDALRKHFNEDIWLLTFQKRYEREGCPNTIISDARFPNEIEFIRSLGGKIIHVSDGSRPVWANYASDAMSGCHEAMSIMVNRFSEVHQSEWAWINEGHDYIIRNEGTLLDLKDSTNELIKRIT